MEYKLKQAEAADMCQSIISVIVGKYIDRIVEAKNDKIELSIMALTHFCVFEGRLASLKSHAMCRHGWLPWL